MIKLILIIICLIGITYIYLVNKKYKNDTSTTKDDIIKYFEEKNATSLETGIKIKDLPEFISKNPYLLMMVKDKTLVYEKGKYYLNK